MEGKWISSMGTWETCASFTYGVSGDLMNYMSCSGVREKRPMVCFYLRLSNLGS